MEINSAPIHIHQFFDSEETRGLLDPGFIPLDNVGQRSDWAEYWPIRNLLLKQDLDEDAWYGVLSPHFKEKTGLSSGQVLEFVKAAAADCDVVMFPLHFDESALYQNVFVQGADSHPGAWSVFVEMARQFAPGVNLETLPMDSSNTQYCNYFVAKPRFWRYWFERAEVIFKTAEDKGSSWGDSLNAKTVHPSAEGRQLKVLAMERLLSLILATEPQWRVHAYDSRKLPALRFPLDQYPEWKTMDELKTAWCTTGEDKHRREYFEMRQQVLARLRAEGKLPAATVTGTSSEPLQPYRMQQARPETPWLHSVAGHQTLARLQRPDPPISIQVLFDAGNPALAAKTRESLQQQIRQPDHIVDTAQDADWAAALRAAPEDWTLLLAPGDTLEADALLLMEHALATAANRDALRVLYFDHDEILEQGEILNPHLKPAFNHDLLLSYPYMSRALLVRNGWAAPLLEAHATQPPLVRAYRLALAALREQDAAGFLRLPAVLAHLTRNAPHTFATTSELWVALAQVLMEHLEQTSPGAQVIEGPGPGTFHVIHPLPRAPKVSIVIPTRDQLHFLSRCVQSLFEKTNYPDFEILIVDNDSQTAEAKVFLSGLESLDPERVRVLRAPGPFNFSRMNNMAVEQARGEFILLLNNDTATVQADWLVHMVRHALRPGVGIVGARLLYPEGKVQHAGVIMGLRGPAEHPCLGLPSDAPGYMFRAQVAQNFSAVTAACLLVSKAVYQEVGGLNEDVFKVSYNDIDFCLRVGESGRRIVFAPLATLIHEGSASQKAGIENLSSEKKSERFGREKAAMYQRWSTVIANDPAYNPNLSLAASGYEYETNPVLCHDKLADLHEHRVLAFAADREGCGNYRIIQPIQAMLEAGLCSGGLSPEQLTPSMALRSGADTLVYQRPLTDHALAALDALLPLKNIRKIFEVDDILTHVPIKSAHRSHMPKDLAARIHRSIGMCDRLVVSTEPLAHEMRNKCDDIRVVLNRIPPALWGKEPPERALTPHQLDRKLKPRVGWAGGVGHLGDLEMIGDVIRDLAGQVDWVFFGMCPPSLRPYIKEVHPGVPTLEYPTTLMRLARTLDLAIAPLEHNLFNECKSNLKLLEYGWSGLPVVCSDITPYQTQGSESLPATRAKNRYKDWRDAILEHVNDPETSRRQGLELQAKVASEWMLVGDNLRAWHRAWVD